MDISDMYKRMLVVVAHPDDETGGCGVLLQRIEEATVVFCTDGAPTGSNFWGTYESREQYACVRQHEARRAMAIAETRHVWFLREAWNGELFRDQELYLVLANAIRRVASAIERYRPEAILTTAYEGGHPDHDSCSFIGAMIGAKYSLPVWEMPLYHRASDGRLVCQLFQTECGPEQVVEPSEDEWKCKTEMLNQYVSQPDLWTFVQSRAERFRTQPAYDYSRPPHQGSVNYEVWQWPVTSKVVCQAFTKAMGAAE